MTTKITTIAQLEAVMKEAFLKYFPNGHVKVSRGSLGGGLCLSIGLIGQTSDCTNNIRQNDPMVHSFWIHDGFDGERIVVEKLVLELGNGGTLAVNPPADSYLAIGNLKLGFRKKTGTVPQVLKHLDNYFKKCAGIVTENKADIYKVEQIPAKYLP